MREDPAVVRDLASRRTWAMGVRHVMVTVEQLLEV
jgi:hypothetical protein